MRVRLARLIRLTAVASIIRCSAISRMRCCCLAGPAAVSAGRLTSGSMLGVEPKRHMYGVAPSMLTRALAENCSILCLALLFNFMHSMSDDLSAPLDILCMLSYCARPDLNTLSFQTCFRVFRINARLTVYYQKLNGPWIDIHKESMASQRTSADFRSMSMALCQRSARTSICHIMFVL